MSNFIKGEAGILFIYDTVTSAYKPTACLTSTSLSSTVSMIESNTKCLPGFTEKDYGIASFSISIDGQYIDTTTVGGDTAKMSHDSLFLLQLAKTKVNFKLDTNVNNATSVKYFGKAIISDLPLDMGSGDDLTTFSATFDVDGNIFLTDPIV